MNKERSVTVTEIEGGAHCYSCGDRAIAQISSKLKTFDCCEAHALAILAQAIQIMAKESNSGIL